MTKDQERVFAALRSLLEKYPGLRVGQALTNTLPVRFEGDPFCVRDGELADCLEDDLS